MNFETIQNGTVTHLKLEESRLDAAHAIQFKEGIRAVADEGAEYILLDMTKVEFMDSSGLGALVSVMKYMGADKKFEITGLTPMVEKVFKLTRMDEVFRVHRSVEDALQAAKNTEGQLS
ncbi:MAG: STAS domain-containing protein [Proteobacteria bacterium]|nr:STAS domain-containing protein [Pseudomonadota bacterium]